jgi:putative transposase
MLKAYKYRLYPTKAQITLLNHTFEICRKVYNNTLALRRDSWDYEQANVSLFETNKELTQWKKEYPTLKDVHSQVLQNVQVRVDLAFKAFFRRVKHGETPGYPRFKSFNRYDSITYPQLGYTINEKSIELSKLGEIKMIHHRKIEGDIKTISVQKTPTNKWFVSIACENVPFNPLPKSDVYVGIDVGLKTFAMLSNGISIENPRFYKIEQDNLAKVQRKASLFEKGSIQLKKAKKVVCLVHERIKNKREDFTHKVSRDLVNKYGTICFEDLNINEMVKNHIYSKGILDAAWSKLVQYTTYKAEDAGRIVVLVNPKNTSQMCSKCGMIVTKDISVRVHKCPHCGYKADRDLNAAINIMRLGLQSLEVHGL